MLQAQAGSVPCSRHQQRYARTCFDQVAGILRRMLYDKVFHLDWAWSAAQSSGLHVPVRVPFSGAPCALTSTNLFGLTPRVGLTQHPHVHCHCVSVTCVYWGTPVLCSCGALYHCALSCACMAGMAAPGICLVLNTVGRAAPPVCSIASPTCKLIALWSGETGKTCKWQFSLEPAAPQTGQFRPDYAPVVCLSF